MGKQSVPQGSVVLMLLYIGAALVMAADGILRPERKYFALLMFTLGLMGSWREYVAWHRRRDSVSWFVSPLK